MTPSVPTTARLPRLHVLLPDVFGRADGDRPDVTTELVEVLLALPANVGGLHGAGTREAKELGMARQDGAYLYRTGLGDRLLAALVDGGHIEQPSAAPTTESRDDTRPSQGGLSTEALPLFKGVA